MAGAHGVAENVAWLGAIALSLSAGMSLDEAFGVAAVVLAASAVLAFVLVIVLTRVRPVDPVPRRRSVPAASRVGRSRRLARLAVVGARMDSFLVGLLSPQGLAVVGIYYAVTRLVGIAEYHPETVSRAIYPASLARVRDGSGRGGGRPEAGLEGIARLRDRDPVRVRPGGFVAYRARVRSRLHGVRMATCGVRRRDAVSFPGIHPRRRTDQCRASVSSALERWRSRS